MKGIDINNLLINYFSFEYKSYKWWKPVFIKILYISLSNCYILHNKFSQKKFDHKNFIIYLVESFTKMLSWNDIHNFTSSEIYSALLCKFESEKRRRCKECYLEKV